MTTREAPPDGWRGCAARIGGGSSPPGGRGEEPPRTAPGPRGLAQLPGLPPTRTGHKPGSNRRRCGGRGRLPRAPRIGGGGPAPPGRPERRWLRGGRSRDFQEDGATYGEHLELIAPAGPRREASPFPAEPPGTSPGRLRRRAHRLPRPRSARPEGGPGRAGPKGDGRGSATAARPGRGGRRCPSAPPARTELPGEEAPGRRGRPGVGGPAAAPGCTSSGSLPCPLAEAPVTGDNDRSGRVKGPAPGAAPPSQAARRGSSAERAPQGPSPVAAAPCRVPAEREQRGAGEAAAPAALPEPPGQSCARRGALPPPPALGTSVSGAARKAVPGPEFDVKTTNTSSHGDFWAAEREEAAPRLLSSAGAARPFPVISLPSTNSPGPAAPLLGWTAAPGPAGRSLGGCHGGGWSRGEEGRNGGAGGRHSPACSAAACKRSPVYWSGLRIRLPSRGRSRMCLRRRWGAPAASVPRDRGGGRSGGGAGAAARGRSLPPRFASRCSETKVQRPGGRAPPAPGAELRRPAGTAAAPRSPRCPARTTETARHRPGGQESAPVLVAAPLSRWQGKSFSRPGPGWERAGLSPEPNRAATWAGLPGSSDGRPRGAGSLGSCRQLVRNGAPGLGFALPGGTHGSGGPRAASPGTQGPNRPRCPFGHSKPLGLYEGASGSASGFPRGLGAGAVLGPPRRTGRGAGRPRSGRDSHRHRQPRPPGEPGRAGAWVGCEPSRAPVPGGGGAARSQKLPGSRGEEPGCGSGIAEPAAGSVPAPPRPTGAPGSDARVRPGAPTRGPRRSRRPPVSLQSSQLWKPTHSEKRGGSRRRCAGAAR